MRRQIDALGVWNACDLVAFVPAFQARWPRATYVWAATGVYLCARER